MCSGRPADRHRQHKFGGEEQQREVQEQTDGSLGYMKGIAVDAFPSHDIVPCLVRRCAPEHQSQRKHQGPEHSHPDCCRQADWSRSQAVYQLNEEEADAELSGGVDQSVLLRGVSVVGEVRGIMLKTNEKVADIFSQEEMLMGLILVVALRRILLILFASNVCACLIQRRSRENARWEYSSSLAYRSRRRPSVRWKGPCRSV